MNTPSEPVLTPTQRTHLLYESLVHQRYTILWKKTHDFALQMAGDLERAQADLANEKSISSLNAKAGLELEKQLAVAQQTIKELENWKSQMLQVWSQIDDHKIAGMLGAVAGQDNFEVINRRVPEVLEQLRQSESGAAGLREIVEAVTDSYQCEPCIDLLERAKKALKSTPAGKFMVARSVLELARDALEELTESNMARIAMNGLTAANQELERSGL